MFSPAGRFDPCVPHPFDIGRPLFLKFDFVYILKDHLKLSNYWAGTEAGSKKPSPSLLQSHNTTGSQETTGGAGDPRTVART